MSNISLLIVCSGASYNYGGATTGLFLFDPSGNGYSAPRWVWSSTSWEWGRTKMTGADQNADGSDELIALYDNGSATSALKIFGPSGSGYAAPRLVWTSGAGFDWNLCQLVAADQDADSKKELEVLYKYDQTTSALWLFDPDLSYAPLRIWQSSAFEWDRTALAAVNPDQDAQEELALLYNYSGATTGLYLHAGTPSLTYAYDQANQLTQIRDTAANLITSLTYDTSGNTLTQTTAGLTTTYAH